MKIRFAMLAAACLLSGSLATPLRGEPFVVLSAGKESCGSFVKQPAQGKEIYLAWAVGFISGSNSRSTGNARFVGQGWDKASLTLWLENFCAASPLVEYGTAVEVLRQALATKQGIPNP